MSAAVLMRAANLANVLSGAGTPGAQPRSRRVAIDLVAFGDVAGCLVGGLIGGLAVIWRGDSDVMWIKLLQVCLLTSLFCYLCLRHFGFYNPERLQDLPVQPPYIVVALFVAMATMYGLGLPLGARVDHTRTWYGVWFLSSFLAILANRIVTKRIFSRWARAGAFQTRLAIYGTGPLADRISETLFAPGRQTVFAGAFDDRGASRSKAAGPGRLGGLEDLIALGRAGEIDQVIIALPQSADRRTAEVARRLEQLPVSLHVVTHISGDLIDPITAHQVSSLGNVGLLDIKTKPLADWGRYLKVAEDYVVASLALIIALPVMVAVAVAIKLDSPGPVFFKQRRHGLNRRVIEVLKFRSMTVMENGGEVQQAKRGGDARVTKVGDFLRRSSLDELPQLFNVLRGEMSLIGPRPHALVHDDHYGEMLERYANRHQVKPGMTGWAQVNGFRGPTETPDKMQSRVECDLAYIDQWSLWLDLKILVMTVFVGFRHKNAV